MNKPALSAPAPVCNLRDYFEQHNRNRKFPLTPDELDRCHLFAITGHANAPALPKGTVVMAVEKDSEEWAKLSGDCLLSLQGPENCLIVGCIRRVNNRCICLRFHNPKLADRQVKRLDVVAVYKIVSIELNRNY